MKLRVGILLIFSCLFSHGFCHQDRLVPGKARLNTAKLSLSEAIAETLNNQWEIFMSQAKIYETEGKYISSKGPFDPVFRMKASQAWLDTWSVQLGINLGEDNVFANIPLVGTFTSREPGGVQVGIGKSFVAGQLEKMTHFGTKLSLTAEVSRERNPFFIFDDPYEDIFEAFEIPFIRKGTATVTFTILQPLIKDFLFNKSVMTEKSQQMQVTSSKYTFVHSMSQQVLDSILAYWDLVKAHKVLKAYIQNEQQNYTFMKDMEEYIDKHQEGQTAIAQPKRAYENSKANVTQAKQQIISAAQKLSIAMGAPEEYLQYCDSSLVLDDFPKKDLSDHFVCEEVHPATEFAMSHRNDVIALDFLKRAANFDVRGAYNETLPSLDLEVSGKKKNTGYENGAKSVMKPFEMPAPEREVKVVLSLNFPIFRWFGKGEYESAKAVKRRINYEYLKLRSEVTAGLIDTISNHNALIRQLREADEALTQGIVYVQEQKTLFKAGLTSLFQLLSSQQKKNFSEIRVIEVEAAYFQNLAKIYYQLGVLVKGNPETGEYFIEETNNVPINLTNL